jgi:hypothetical protein
MINEGLRRWIVVQLFGVILVVDIVSNTDKLSSGIRAGQEDDSHTENLRRGQASQVRRVGLEDELVDADRNRPDQDGVQFLVILCRSGRSYVSELPFEVCILLAVFAFMLIHLSSGLVSGLPSTRR